MDTKKDKEQHDVDLPALRIHALQHWLKKSMLPKEYKSVIKYAIHKLKTGQSI